MRLAGCRHEVADSRLKMEQLLTDKTRELGTRMRSAAKHTFYLKITGPTWSTFFFFGEMGVVQ